MGFDAYLLPCTTPTALHMHNHTHTRLSMHAMFWEQAGSLIKAIGVGFVVHALSLSPSLPLSLSPPSLFSLVATCITSYTGIRIHDFLFFRVTRTIVLSKGALITTVQAQATLFHLFSPAGRVYYVRIHCSGVQLWFRLRRRFCFQSLSLNFVFLFANVCNSNNAALVTNRRRNTWSCLPLPWLTTLLLLGLN